MLKLNYYKNILLIKKKYKKNKHLKILIKKKDTEECHVSLIFLPCFLFKFKLN